MSNSTCEVCGRRKDDAVYPAQLPLGCVREGKHATEQERQWHARDCYRLGYEREKAAHEKLHATHNAIINGTKMVYEAIMRMYSNCVDD